MNIALIELFSRDLDSLKTEIASYKTDAHCWKIEKEIKNSAGNLAIHLVGNLNHFIGAVLGKTGYIRDRDGEFNNKNIPKEQIISDIDKIKELIKKVISNLSVNDLQKNYPINIRKEEMSVEQFLIHLYGHLNYHLGQINYHRRLID